MKAIKLISLLTLFTCCALVANAQQNKYCKLYGQVFIVDNPAQADYIIYEESSEAFAEVRLFEEQNSLFADHAGIWFFCESFELADFRVYFTDERYQAHFTVYFIDTASFAGCN